MTAFPTCWLCPAYVSRCRAAHSAPLLLFEPSSPSSLLAPGSDLPYPCLPRVPLVPVLKLSGAGWEPGTGRERVYGLSLTLYSWGQSQQSPCPGCSLPLNPGAEPVLRTVCAVLPGLLGPWQSPISCAPFDLLGDLQGKGEFGFDRLLLAPVRSAWVPLPP